MIFSIEIIVAVYVNSIRLGTVRSVHCSLQACDVHFITEQQVQLGQIWGTSPDHKRHVTVWPLPSHPKRRQGTIFLKGSETISASCSG